MKQDVQKCAEGAARARLNVIDGARIMLIDCSDYCVKYRPLFLLSQDSIVALHADCHAPFASKASVQAYSFQPCAFRKCGADSDT